MLQTPLLLVPLKNTDNLYCFVSKVIKNKKFSAVHHTAESESESHIYNIFKEYMKHNKHF